MRFRGIATLFRRLFNLVQSGTKSFIDNRPKRFSQCYRKSPRSLDHVIINGYGRSHERSWHSTEWCQSIIARPAGGPWTPRPIALPYSR